MKPLPPITLNAIALVLIFMSTALATAPNLPIPKPDKPAIVETGLDPQKLLELAQAAFCAGDYKTSRELADHCIALLPQNAEAFNIRASARFGLLDFEGAIADYDRAEALGSGDGCRCRLFNRGLSYFALGNYAAAAKDLGRHLSDEPDELSPYTRLWLILAILNRGQTPPATLYKNNPAQWPGVVFEHFQGRATRAEVLAQAALVAGPETLREILSEAFYFLGQWALLKDDDEGLARQDFRKVLSLGYTRCNEYRLSVAALKKRPASKVLKILPPAD